MKTKKLVLVISIAAVAAAAFFYFSGKSSNNSDSLASDKSTGKPVTSVPINYCADNTETQLALVSVSKRHMWACEGSNQVYDSAVVTGYEGYPETLTPVGTYKISARQIDQPLVGSDRLGSWNVHVDYWLPFLTNQYGNYGFHDATWRADSAFGNIDPNSKDASHGCVEVPLSAMKWLYDWSIIGTVVKVES